MKSTVALLTVLLMSMAFPVDPNVPGDLSITVFVSPTDKFIEEWFATPAEHGPTLKRIKEARANQLVHVGFVVTGQTAGENGATSLEVDVRVIYPDGEILFMQDSFANYKGTPKSAGFVLADPVLQLMIELTDPMGLYTIQAVVHDRVTGTTATGETTLTITP